MISRIGSHHNLIIGILLVLITVGCGSSKSALISNASRPPANAVPDYNNLYYWAAHPYKKDLSDSTPKPYRNFETDSTVDVFFIHPTTYVDAAAVNDSLLNDPAERQRWNASIDDSALNDKTDLTTIFLQASAFNHYRVFAPRYRQAHIKAFFINDTLSKPFFDTAYEDVKNAFDFYMQHYNNGRPFIIASHSQGTLHAGRLIKDIEHTPLINKMVVAYIIGMPVPEHYFSKCIPCSTATQTGCFVSWRTFHTNFIAPWVAKEKYKAVVVNPLTWTLDTLTASKKLNNGAVLFKFNKPVTKAVSATISGNVLWASKPHFFGSIFYTNKNYHIGDINLFWKNIRDNVDDRVNAYKKLHH